ncbi:sensor histidine kinase [Paenibacillus silviterrae]|uniref:sensor histidine kinase n=1 Tax=Paenibacillus silviterrae TaxID=3242194 RepID=UPI002543B236|nr:sensor histidine kinase [Paenibacillus chinjuensis]
MATKSKNNRFAYAAWLLLTSCSLLAVLTAWDIFQHRALFHKDFYFHSQAFQNQLSTHYNLIKYIHVTHKNYSEWTAADKIGQDRLTRMEQHYSSLRKQKENELAGEYREKRTEARSKGAAEGLARLEQEETQKAVEALRLIDQQLEKEKQRIVDYQDGEYRDIRRSLEQRSQSLHYYLKDRLSGEVYTNLPSAPNGPQLKDALYAMSFPGSYPQQPFLQAIGNELKQRQLEGWLIIPSTDIGYNQFRVDIAYYDSVRERLMKELILLAAAVLIAVSTYLYMRKTGLGQQNETERLSQRLEQIPIDLRYAIPLVMAALTFGLASPSAIFRLPVSGMQLVSFLLPLLMVLCLLLYTQHTRDLLRNREELIRQCKASLTGRAFELVRSSLAYKKIMYKAALLFILTALLGFIAVLLIIALDDGAGGLAAICSLYFGFYLLIVVPYVMKRIAALHAIFTGAEAVAAGDLHHTVKFSGSGNLQQLAHHLNSMQHGFRKALDSQMRSERLKAELITNVSHDLKTPLTSIINYINLLKNEELTQEQTVRYIEVLDRKTDRLKVLIEDLFEASKMASGAVELQLEKVNVSSLLSQALAEFSDRFAASNLTFKVQVPDHKVYATLDGKKTWRVFENLIGNALKYAMPNTRVHLTLEETDTSVLFTIKNVSAYPIDFEAEELFERFKRGDQSRHTEGSGLGLAIAKSIVDLQGGRLTIELDGDYFKAIVQFVK